MPNKFIFIPIVTLIFLLIDLYVFQAVKFLTSDATEVTRKLVYGIFWVITAIAIASLWVYNLGPVYNFSRGFKTFLMASVFVTYFSKLFVVIFLFIDDLTRGVEWLWQLLKPSSSEVPKEFSTNGQISRHDFLVKSAALAGAVPFGAMTFGILSGAHDYRLRRQQISLPNLPSQFHGFKLVQISDVHSGSFFNKTAVMGGVEMILKEKPDVIFFTGDLVNNKADEMAEYQAIFSKVKAPLGVYSTLGNHDYGDYVQWPSLEAKTKNLADLKVVHKQMGWNLMMNENKVLVVDNAQIAILGIENYGAKGRFPKYGKLDQAYHGTQEIPVKLLLSHDPSHWDAQVNSQYKDIDVMFAGHTHGMQFGVEIAGFQWSPVQYMYEQWAGLYKKENQYLYVNRGFGYLGFPGRIGMPPEITVVEFLKG